MTQREPDDRQVSIGRVLSRAFAAIGGNPVVFLGTALLFGALPSAGITYLTQQVRLDQLTPDYVAAYMVATVGSAIAGVVLQAVVQGALVRATLAHAEGRRAALGEALWTALRAAVPLVGLGVLTWLGIVLGMIFFIVPGIILWVMWAVAAPALVAERRGIVSALGRSRALTKGARWAVFGLQLLVLVLYWMASGTVAVANIAATGVAVPGTTPGRATATYWVLTVLVTTVGIAVRATVQTSLFVELRAAKEGPARDALEDIFA